MNKKMAEHTGLLIIFFYASKQSPPLSKLFKVTLSECKTRALMLMIMLIVEARECLVVSDRS